MLHTPHVTSCMAGWLVGCFISFRFKTIKTKGFDVAHKCMSVYVSICDSVYIRVVFVDAAIVTVVVVYLSFNFSQGICFCRSYTHITGTAITSNVVC